MTFDIGWSDSDWHQVEQAAQGAFAEAARVRAAFAVIPAVNPRAIDMPDQIQLGHEDGWTLGYAAPTRPVHLACDFLVRADQLEDLAAVQRLARRAGQSLGAVETGFFLEGRRPTRGTGVKLTQPEELTFTDLAAAARAGGEAALAGADAYHAAQALFVDAVRTLHEEGRYGPYTLFVDPVLRRFYDADLGGQMGSRGLRRLLGEASPVTVQLITLNAKGLLIDMAGGPVDIVDAEPAQLSVLGYKDGGVRLRFAERTMLRIWDAGALRRLRVRAAQNR